MPNLGDTSNLANPQLLNTLPVDVTWMQDRLGSTNPTDWFDFNLSQSSLFSTRISWNGNTGANLKLSVYNANNQLLGSYSSPNAASVTSGYDTSIKYSDTVLPAGNYRVEVVDLNKVAVNYELKLSNALVPATPTPTAPTPTEPTPTAPTPITTTPTPSVSAQPDLTGVLSSSTTSVTQGTTFPVDLLLKNIGDTSATTTTPIAVEVYLDNNPTPFWTKSYTGAATIPLGLPALVAPETLSIDTAGLSGGVHKVTMKVDPSNRIAETNDTNNNTTFSFSVQGTTTPPVTGIDTTPPQLTNKNPLDGATNVANNTNIVLTFNEAVKAGNGTIELYNYNDLSAPGRTIAITDSSQVTFSGNQLIINPATDLLGPHVEVRLNSGVVTDVTGNAFVGLKTGELDFTVGTTTLPTDTIAPLLTVKSPVNNATNVAGSDNIVLTFNEPVKAGTGTIDIYNLTTVGSSVPGRTIAVTDTSQVTFSGNQLIINPTTDISDGSKIEVRLNSGVIKDTAGNAYAGLSAGQFGFTTGSAAIKDTTPPVLDSIEYIESWSDLIETAVSALPKVVYNPHSVAGQAYRLYNAVFSRTPDASGLDYWTNTLNSGKSLVQIAASFMQSPEFMTMYGQNLSYDTFVTKAYNNVLNRPPEPAGKGFWMNDLNAGKITLAGVLASLSESNENQNAVLTVANQMGVLFDNKLAKPPSGLDFKGSSPEDILFHFSEAIKLGNNGTITIQGLNKAGQVIGTRPPIKVADFQSVKKDAQGNSIDIDGNTMTLHLGKSITSDTIKVTLTDDTVEDMSGNPNESLSKPIVNLQPPKYPFLTLAKFSFAAYDHYDNPISTSSIRTELKNNGWKFLKVTKKDGGSLSLSEDSSDKPFFTVDNASNAAAVVAKKGSSLVLSFRGTDDANFENIIKPGTDPYDWFHQKEHYARFDSLIESIKGFIDDSSNGIKKVYVTGHSLGGVMATWYLTDSKFGGNALKSKVNIFGAAFGAPEAINIKGTFDTNIPYYRFEVAGDPVPDIAQIVKTTADYYIPDMFQETKESVNNLSINPGKQINLVTKDSVADYFDLSSKNIKQDFVATLQKSINLHIFSYLPAIETLNKAGVFSDANFPQYEKQITENLGNDTFNPVLLRPDAKGVQIKGDYVTTKLPETYTNNDFIVGTSGEDTLEGLEGNDTLIGGMMKDTLWGGVGNDTLKGNQGNDVLDGGAGQDHLYGGDDNNTFQFYTEDANGDVIYDFTLTDQLKFLFSGTQGTFIGENQFSAINQVRVEYSANKGGKTAILYGNTDNNIQTSEFTITILGMLKSSDYLQENNFIFTHP